MKYVQVLPPAESAERTVCCLSVCLSDFLSVCLSVFLFFLSAFLSVCLSCLSVRPSVYLSLSSVCLSVCLRPSLSLTRVHRYFQQQNPQATQFALPNEMHDGKRANGEGANEKKEKRANDVYLHVTVPVGGELDIVFTSFNANSITNGDGAAGVAAAARALSGAGFAGKLERRLRAFDGRFDSLY